MKKKINFTLIFNIVVIAISVSLVPESVRIPCANDSSRKWL